MKFSATRAKSLSGVFFAAVSLALMHGCGGNPLAPTDRSVIEGKVLNAATGRPLDGVLVRSFAFAQTALTNVDGIYTLEADLADSNSRVISLAFTREGYFESSVTVTIQNGEKTFVPDVQLVQKSGPIGGVSGDAANVVLVDVQERSVFVKGSGANETSNLTFEVRDAKGIPVDLDHQVTVRFSRVAGPGGGETVDPDTALTDANGQAVTTLNSGTLAGTVQIVASVEGAQIQSEPVPVAITGWLPHAGHFTIAVESRNFAGFDVANLRDAITVLVGDRFSNPVPPGTSVRFSSSGGVIQGSATTNNDGQATVDLISGLPRPQGLNFGSLRVIDPSTLPTYFQDTGYALVTAETIDENNSQIYAEAVVLFSGQAIITNVSPTTFDLAPDEFVDISFTVSDQNSNPLAAGTSITVTTNNGGATGDNALTLGGNLLRTSTQFRVRLANSKPGEIEGEPTTVTINVAGPNGSAKVDLFGFMRRF